MAAAVQYDIPAHGWTPRWYQEDAWHYMQAGRGIDENGQGIPGRNTDIIAHRRWGKDDICLHHASVQTFLRPGTYWHMLPMANQVRKAIWQAINPHTGRRRIEDAFPEKYFQYKEHEMMVINRETGSTWQCLGSDNFGGSIGSPPVGLVFSEWALANPYALGYLRPILAENQGWQVKISTPRGKNHAYASNQNAIQRMNDGQDSFGMIQDVAYTQMIDPEELINILVEYKDLYGEENGLALYLQEFDCDFEAALIGTYYSSQFKEIDRSGRIRKVPWDPQWPVHIAMDIGRTDATAIWFWQNVHGVPKVIDFWAESYRDPDYVASQILGYNVSINIVGDPHTQKRWIEVDRSTVPVIGATHRQDWDIGSIWLPHDGAAKTFAAKGKSVQEQLAAVFGWDKLHIVPNLSLQDGIQATRQFLKICEIDEGVDTEGMRQYRREWSMELKRFKDHPLHDWCSDHADGFRYMSIANRHDTIPRDPDKAKFPIDRNFQELVKANTRKRKRREAA